MPPRFSSRLPWTTALNNLSAAVERRRADHKPFLDLTVSNPTAVGISYPALHEAFADARMTVYEPDPRGMRDAREAVAAYYGRRVAPEQILLTASTSEAYSYIFKLLCDPGDEVLVPRPSYPLFDTLAQLECVRVVQYPLRYHDGWFIDVPALRSAINDRTRAIVCVNPNNPTGSYLKDFEYEQLAELCRDTGIALISDEVFADYPLQPDPSSLRSLATLSGCLCFSLSGLSKVAGMPQMKLGWIVVSGLDRDQALQRLEWIADTFLSVGTPVQTAATALLDARHAVQLQIRERTANNLEYLRNATRGSPFHALRVEGGWSATLQAPRIRSEEDWTLHLLEGGVLVQPGYFFDYETEAFLVVSLLTQSDVFHEGVQHILDAC